MPLLHTGAGGQLARDLMLWYNKAVYNAAECQKEGKNVKKYRLILNLLTALPLAAALAALIFLPDEIPVHFGMDNLADRWGSKYEVFIFPVLVLLARLTMAGLTRLAVSTDKDNESARPVMEVATLCVLAIFDAMSLYFIWAGFVVEESLNELPIGIWQLMTAGAGAMFIPSGLAMQKAPRNGLYGFRTKWSLMNDEVWRLSQRFAGRAMAAAGAVIVLLALLLPGAWSALAAAFIIVAVLTAGCFYAKRTYFRLRGFDD